MMPTTQEERNKRKAARTATPALDNLARMRRQDEAKRERVRRIEAALRDAYSQGVADGFEAAHRLALDDEDPA
jgi:flagellar biosynthesis/type III secretory pathway protein FliH